LNYFLSSRFEERPLRGRKLALLATQQNKNNIKGNEEEDDIKKHHHRDVYIK